MTNTVNYFGYGANRSQEMMEAMVGRVAQHRAATLHDFELVIQQPHEIPETVRKILSESWTVEELDVFRTYAIRRNAGAQVKGILWELDPLERELVDNWELNDGLWYAKMDVDVQTSSGIIRATTEIIDDPSLSAAATLEPGLPVFLNSKPRMLEVANRVRAEYLNQTN